MTRRLVCFAVLAVCSVAAAQRPDPDIKPGEARPQPKDGFSSASELEHWAQTSSFGGGFAKKMRLGFHDVYIVDRCLTSGVPLFELSVYVQSSPTSRLRLLTSTPAQLGLLRESENDNTIVVQRRDKNKDEWSTVFILHPDIFEPSIDLRLGQ
jgi:hypothetical protein